MSYIHALMKAHALGLIKPGDVAQVEVAHDSDCPALKRRECRCRPGVLLFRSGEVIRIWPDGTVEQEARTQ